MTHFSKLKRLGLFSLPLFLITSCGINETKNSGSNNHSGQFSNSQINPNEHVSYAKVNSLVFQISCRQCHLNGQAAGGVRLDSYAEAIQNLDDIKSTVFDSDPEQMPPDGMADYQKELLQQWISQGAVNVPAGAPAPTATPTPTATPVLVATYQSIRDDVFVAKCLMCHAPGQKASKDPLDTYAAMMAKGNLVVAGDLTRSTVVTEIEAGKMPPAKANLPAVTPDELAIIKTWITNGANP